MIYSVKRHAEDLELHSNILSISIAQTSRDSRRPESGHTCICKANEWLRTFSFAV